MSKENTKGTITVSIGKGSQFYGEGDAAMAAHLNSLPNEKGAWFIHHPPVSEVKPRSQDETIRDGIG